MASLLVLLLLVLSFLAFNPFDAPRFRSLTRPLNVIKSAAKMLFPRLIKFLSSVHFFFENQRRDGKFN